MTKLELAQALATANARIGALSAQNDELTLKLKGQIKRGNLLKDMAVTATVAPVRDFKAAMVIARERGITVQAAMRVAA